MKLIGSILADSLEQLAKDVRRSCAWGALLEGQSYRDVSPDVLAREFEAEREDARDRTRPTREGGPSHVPGMGKDREPKPPASLHKGGNNTLFAHATNRCRPAAGVAGIPTSTFTGLHMLVMDVAPGVHG